MYKTAAMPAEQSRASTGKKVLVPLSRYEQALFRRDMSQHCGYHFSRLAGATRLQTDCGTPQSVTSATIKSAVACGAACGDAGTHNVCAHRMSQSDDFVLITKTFGRETSPITHSLWVQQ